MAASSAALLQSLDIILREGFEVVLVVGAMLTVLRKIGAAGRAGALWWGVGLGVLASLVTAVGLEALFRSHAGVEALEGATMLAAGIVLLAVGHWLLAKADVARWKRYLERRLRGASARGS